MARSFSGSGTDGIDIGDPAAYTFGSTVTLSLSAWIYPTSNTDGIIFGKLTSGAESFVLRFDRSASNKIAFVIFNSASVGSALLSTTLSSSLVNTWVSVVGTWDGTTQKIYINGALDNSVAFGGTGLGSLGGNHWCIGHDFANGNTIFTGNIADCGLWNVTLTAAEIAALNRGARPLQIRPSALVGYWPLTGLQSPEPDLSGNKNNGTLTGTTPAFGPPIAQFTPRWPQFNTPPPVITNTLWAQSCM